ncbi:MAG: ComEC/Rec2 family competence protein [Lachnospiraceae bacterium]|nr:ComEC/Rec2 family competence protein [Lachnospiraceae bacterium]
MLLLLFAAVSAWTAIMAGEYRNMILAASFILCCSLAVKLFTDRAFSGMLLPVFLLAFFAAFSARIDSENALEKAAGEMAGEDRVLYGTVTDVSSNKMTVRVTCGGVSIGGVMIYSEEASGDICPGCDVEIAGDLFVMQPATNPGQFDEREHYRAKEIYSKMFSPQISVISPGGGILKAAYTVRRFLEEAVRAVSSEEEEGVFLALITGQRSEIDERIRDLFSDGGIAHILAISGLHISFFGMMLFALLRKGGASYTVAGLISCFLVAFYTLLTGAPVSALRACVMFTISVFAAVFGRSYDMISAMSLSWIIIALLYPYSLLGAGFLFSFGAIAGLSVLLPAISAFYERKPQKKRLKAVLAGFRDSLSGGLCVSLVTYPVTAWFYYCIPFVSVLLNLIVIPLMSVLMSSLFIGIVFYCLSPAFAPAIYAARAFVIPARLILKLYILLCDGAGELDFMRLSTGRPLTWQMILYYAILAFLLIMVILAGRRYEAAMEDKDRTALDDEGNVKRKIRAPLIVIPLTALTLALLCPLLIRPKPERPMTVFIDIGQGDGAVMISKNATIVFDAGSSSKNNAADLLEGVMMFFRAGEIDAWFLSHPDSDHYSAMAELMRGGMEVGCVYINGYVDERSLEPVREAAETAGADICRIGPGSEFGAGYVHIECIGPIRDYDDENANSLVLRVDTGKDIILFTGDISAEAELDLVRYCPEKLSCDILKVAHHGSRFSSSGEFLCAASPSLAVISCGVNNYGHPSPEVLDRLAQQGVDVHVTLYEGAAIRY